MRRSVPGSNPHRKAFLHELETLGPTFETHSNARTLYGQGVEIAAPRRNGNAGCSAVRAVNELPEEGLAFVDDDHCPAGEVFIKKRQQLDEQATYRVRAAPQFQEHDGRPGSRFRFHQSGEPVIASEHDSILQSCQPQDLRGRKIAGADFDGMNGVVARSLELLDHQEGEEGISE